MERSQAAPIRRDLERKMVFLAGPRQVGKTTLAQSLLQDPAGYLNWDVPEHRERILLRQWPVAPSLLVLDEVHKFHAWRGLVKGLYDGGRKRILVTGSARLDFYRHGGDSLQGRYHFHRLHPLSFAELKMRSAEDLRRLLEFGGFPEPFLGGSAVDARRWSREYRTRLIREDLVSLERVQDLGRLELLMLRLPELVGSPLSLNSLREDLQVAHKTLSHWADILERLYAIFRIPPLGAPRLRAVKKERKHYHLDWTLVQAAGPRFENLVASHLLKWVHFGEDVRGRNLELRYFRDVEGREVDFVVTEDLKPLLLVECKSADDAPSPSLRYLKARFPSAAAWQVSASGRKDYESSEGIRVAPAPALLATLV